MDSKRRMFRGLRLAGCAAAALFATCNAAGEQADSKPVTRPFPADASWTDVTKAPYSADNTGRTDATEALRRAIGDILARKRKATGNKRTAGHFALYFPDGTYRVRDSLSFGTDKDLSLQIHIRGQSRDGTILRLEDNAPGFAHAAQPRPVLSFFDGAWSNVGFSNTIEDMTIDVGAGNSGAVALVFHNNNVGCVRRVTLRSGDTSGAGAVGLQLGRRLAGIGLVKDLEVRGFDVGISNDDNSEHVTYVLEHVKLSGQRKAGIVSRKKGLSVRRLDSDNRVPALVQDEGSGQVVLLDSILRGGAPDQPAIRNTNGWLLARNVQTRGYGVALRERGKDVAGSAIAEHVTGGVQRLWDDAPAKTLNLPVEETPEVAWDDPPAWAIVDGSAQDDDTRAIQAAVDSGRTTVYLSRASYTVSDTIRLRGDVRRFHGGWSRLNLTPEFTRQAKPVFLFEDGKQPAVVVEAIDSAFGYFGRTWYFQNDASRTLVLRDLFLPYGAAYRNTGAGKLFIEDICSGGATKNYQALPGWVFKNQPVWARHLNHEGSHPHVVNDGGKLWILGFKMGEEHGPYFITRNGGRTELLGGVLNALGGPRPPDLAAVINEGSDVSVSLLERSTTRQGAPHPVTIREIRGGQTRELKNTDLPRRADPSVTSPAVPLYRGKGAAK